MIYYLGQEAKHMNISEIIETKINNAQYGTVFIVSDFISIASYDTVRKILSRLSHKKSKYLLWQTI